MEVISSLGEIWADADESMPVLTARRLLCIIHISSSMSDSHWSERDFTCGVFRYVGTFIMCDLKIHFSSAQFTRCSERLRGVTLSIGSHQCHLPPFCRWENWGSVRLKTSDADVVSVISQRWNYCSSEWEHLQISIKLQCHCVLWLWTSFLTLL